MSEENKNTDREELEPVTVEIKETEEKPRNQRRKLSLSTFVCSAAALCVVAVMLTYTVCTSFYKKEIAKTKLESSQTIKVESDSRFAPLDTLEWIFKTYGFQDLDDEQTLNAVLKAYVAATGDRYAAYYTNEEYKAQMSDIAGESVGIGVSVINDYVTVNGIEYDTIKILKIFKGGPAYSSELRVGDRIAWLGTVEESVSVGSVGYNAAVNQLRGEAGTEARFVVIREEADGKFTTKEIAIKRAEYEIESVSGKKISGTNVGYVLIDSFDIATIQQFEQIIDGLIDEGCEKFVYDVRNNPGGEMSSIVSILGYFLEKGDVVLSTKDIQGTEVVIKANDKSYCRITESDFGKYAKYDSAVLCNGSTASAAELFVSNFRDHSLGEIVGTKTYGKGSVQTFMPLTLFGIEGVLKYTNRKYFPPCGEGYDGIGIYPKEENQVELSDEAKQYNVYERPVEKDNQLQKALECLK